MGARILIAIIFIIIGLIGAIGKYVSLVLGVGIVLIGVLFLIRKGADIFWWGKDNGKW